jgi:hypothetical protein
MEWFLYGFFFVFGVAFAITCLMAIAKGIDEGFD